MQLKPFELWNYFVMNTELSLSELLEQLSQQLKYHQHWQDTAPPSQALLSTEPFAIDALSSLEWLQWIFIPRMVQLIKFKQGMPSGFSITPYIEETIKGVSGELEIIKICQLIDQKGKL